MEERKPFGPITHNPSVGAFALAARINPRKRNRSTTVGISQEAFVMLLPIVERIGGSIGGVSGFLVDYLARSGKFSELLDEAMREGQQ